MSNGTWIALIIGGFVVFFLAINRGLVQSGVTVGPAGAIRGITAPQPTQNYGGYLAATTAPAVSTAASTALTGMGSAFAAWLKGTPAPQPTAPPTQGSNPASPSLAAQPSGPSASAAGAITAEAGGWAIGPQPPAAVSYNSTSGAAFDYSGLASDNGYDAIASLYGPGTPDTTPVMTATPSPALYGGS